MDFRMPHRHLLDLNKAQLVVLREKGLIDSELTQALAGALIEVEREATEDESGFNYLDLEARLIAKIGEAAANLHLGRSRNDIGATINRLRMREQVLDALERLLRLRAAVQKLARAHQATVMPGFTHGVQAQPTTLAHYLSALDGALQRDGERLVQVYARINRSPLGSGAFTTSSFELDRPLLAELLGFEGLIENSYDAIMLSVADSKVELTQALALAALGLGRFLQDLMMQYRDARPGIFLGDGATSRSSVMPQKRNPSRIEKLRFLASEIVGEAATSAFAVHNTPMYEVKDARNLLAERVLETARRAARLFDGTRELIEVLEVNATRLREQVDEDYSTMTELADVLHREAGLPFRRAYGVASEVTNLGRSRGETPARLDYGEACAAYRKLIGEEFPFSERRLRQLLDPAELVRNRRGLGGPQSSSVNRMLEASAADVAERRTWLEGEIGRLARTSADLDDRVRRLM